MHVKQFLHHYELRMKRDRQTVLVPKFYFKPYFWKYEGWNFNSGNYLFTTDTK